MKLMVVLLILCIGLSAGSQEVQKSEDLRSLLEPIRKKHGLPALAGAIVTSHGVIAAGAVGVRKYGTDIPVTIHDEFHLGSDTKAMTATLLAMLVAEGKLSWKSTLAQLFPDLAKKMNPAYREVTLEQMLAHRAGFSDQSWPEGKTFLDMYNLHGTPREQRKAYVAMILAESPVNEPGKAFLYSNRSYAVAGAVAETVANESWEKLMQERIFGPLGMTTCGFGSMGTAEKVDQPWQHKLVFGKHLPIAPGPLADNPAVIAPAGTVHCSILDWAKFIQVHLQGEQGQSNLLKLKPETIKYLHTAPMGGSYGFGWLIVERPWAGGRALNHAGSNTQNYAVVWIAPTKDFAVLVMTNQADAGEKTFKACDEAASALIQKSLAMK